MAFISNEENGLDVKDIFITDTWLVDRFVGSELWTWGNGSSGQLGDNTTVRKSSPVQTIAGGTNWKQVVCGFFHTAAIKTDGTLWNWLVLLQTKPELVI